MNTKPVILVSGKNGQLGKELQDVCAGNEHFQFIFFDKDELNIADEAALKTIFQKHTPAFFINCAAYTAVDKAEHEKDVAYKINAEAVASIAACCNDFKTKLIHVSTDYVFDGKATQPYKEDAVTDPVNYYGTTKLSGEDAALKNNADTIIIRTSWVYSKYGNNFVKTMLRLMKERKELNVVNDQFGSPTYAKDMAEAIISIINSEWLIVNDKLQTANLKLQTLNGVYHFSNDGTISWFDFATAIQQIKQLDCVVHPIATSSYPTPAKRPAYSVFDKTKIAAAFNISIKNWKESLEECLRFL